MAARKRGGQPGNENAVKHGRFRASVRAERRAALLAAAEQRRIIEQAWAAKAPVIDYGAICATIRRYKAR
jgi:hypothetical protein